MNIEINNLADDIVDRLVHRISEVNKTIHYTELPSLGIGDTARYLGCSLPHVHTLMQRYPEYLKPLEGRRGIRFSTEKLIEFKRTGLAKAGQRKTKIAWDAEI